MVFTLPAPIADVEYQNKAALCGLLFDIAAETLQRIAADPKHLGASIGATLVLHTWGSALTHHPHVHGIVPGGGLAPDGQHWVASRLLDSGAAFTMTALHHRRPTRRRLRRAVGRFVCCLSTAPRRCVAGHCRITAARAKLPAIVGAVLTRRHGLLDCGISEDQSP